jgi:glycosyltransferase involved in cell wall biosynthesis
MFATRRYEDELFSGMGSLMPGCVSRVFRRESKIMGSTALSWKLDYRTHNSDIVHATFQTIAPAIYFSNPSKFIVTVHDILPLISDSNHDISTKIQWKLTPSALKKSDGIIAISNFTKKEILSHLDIDPCIIHVVHQGVDHSVFYPMEKIDSRAKLGLDPEGIYILVVSSNQRHKRMDIVGKILHEIRKINPKIQLLKIGYGGHLPLDGVINMGWIPENKLPLLYNSANLYLHTSDYEGFGLPILESMACGVPTVANDRASIPEILGPNEAIDMNNVKISKLCSHILSKMDVETDVKALERSNKFSWEKTSKETLKVYEKVFEI